MQLNDNLIIDAGMHIGKDTEFYLKKGFDVIGIEANPDLVKQVKKRLSHYINEGRLKIYNVAINNYDGEVDFYINQIPEVWGTISKEIADRYEQLYSTNYKLKVKCTRFEKILKEYGIPYYLKADIEGSDILCLEALISYSIKPKYISIETNLTSFEEVFKELSLMWQLGYRQFKILNQVLNYKIKCPNPPLEGKFVDAKFDELTSGTFGEETPGNWLDIEQTFKRYKKNLREQYFFGERAGKYPNTILHKLYSLYRKITFKEPVGWYDLHGKFGE